MSAYYAREQTTHLDGTKLFQTEEDRAHERSVAQQVAERWSCDVLAFGALSPVDWFASRHGRLVGVLELKSRSHDAGRYPTVFLNVRKWLALSLASVGLGCPAVFVVRFEDGIRWVPVARIDAGANRIGGCLRIVKAANDIEPVIEVPIASLAPLVGGK